MYSYRAISIKPGSMLVTGFALLVSFLPNTVSAAMDAGSQPESSRVANSVLNSAGSSTDPMSASYMAQLVLGLIIVLLCIVALAWLAKRFNRLQSTPDGSLQVLGGMSMGARERIVLVQVGTKQLLLGVAPGQINTLHVLDEPLEAVSDVHPRMHGQGFAEKLSAAISRKGSR